MKIITRKNKAPASSSPLWVIPSFSYGLMKLVGTEFNEYEVIWWWFIPIMFMIWLIVNFKIVK